MPKIRHDTTSVTEFFFLISLNFSLLYMIKTKCINILGLKSWSFYSFAKIGRSLSILFPASSVNSLPYFLLLLLLLLSSWYFPSSCFTGAGKKKPFSFCSGDSLVWNCLSSTTLRYFCNFCNHVDSIKSIWSSCCRDRQQSTWCHLINGSVPLWANQWQICHLAFNLYWQHPCFGPIRVIWVAS